MFVETTTYITFSGTPTTQEEREFLRARGFVHLTGLSVYQNSSLYYVIGERLRSEDLGKYGYNNGKTVIVTTGGELWIGMPKQSPTDIFEKFCPNGGGAFVPLSRGEGIGENILLMRFADPDYQLITKPAP